MSSGCLSHVLGKAGAASTTDQTEGEYDAEHSRCAHRTSTAFPESDASSDAVADETYAALLAGATAVTPTGRLTGMMAPMDSTDDLVAASTEGARTAQRRLLDHVAAVTDDQVRGPSNLPGWTVGHVLTHIARNADSFTRMMRAVIAGDVVSQYADGVAGRAAGIEAGAARSARELIEDVATSNTALEATWSDMTPAAWQGNGRTAGDTVWPCASMPFHRWREVEVHHVDLGLGYTSADWPDDYVRAELALAVEMLPARLSIAAQHDALAWLIGRGDAPVGVELAPWRPHVDQYPRSGTQPAQPA
jgi:maleylpyruvate isomerase